MSERRFESGFSNESLPTGYSVLSGIEAVEKDGEIVRFNGIVKLGEGEHQIERRVEIPDLAPMFGHDPEARQNYNTNPSLWDKVMELSGQISSLSERVASLEAENQSLRNQIVAVQAENEIVSAENLRLNQELEELRNSPAPAAERAEPADVPTVAGEEMPAARDADEVETVAVERENPTNGNVSETVAQNVPAETAADTAVAEPAPPSAYINTQPFGDGRFSRFWRWLNGVPPGAKSFEVEAATGRTVWVAPPAAEGGVEVREYYGNRRGVAAAAAAVIALAAGAWGLWQTLETEDIEATVHRIEANQHGAQVNKDKEPASEEQSAAGTPAAESSANNSKASENAGASETKSETKPDNDEPLSGTSTYFENSHVGGHGLELKYPRKTEFKKNQDGTYTFKLANGKKMKLVWNTQGKLTPDTVRAIKKENLEVGWAHTKFMDREGSTYSHQYSVIGDQ
jgi:regulator of replication initiation timing